MSDNNDASLQRVFQFDDTDLEQNRRGQLSTRQKRHLLVKLLFSFDFIVMLLVGVPAIIYLILQVLYPDGFSITLPSIELQVVQPDPDLFSIFNLIVLVGAGLLMFEGLSLTIATVRDIISGKVERWNDNFAPRKRVGRKSGIGMVNIYELLIEASPNANRAGLVLTKRQFQGISGRGQYEVFVAKYTRTIVAMLHAKKSAQDVSSYSQNKPAMQSLESVPPMTDNPFAEIFQFTQADLEMNREGFLTDNQADYIRKTRGFGGIGDGTVVAYEGNIEKWDDVGMKGNKKYYLKFENEAGDINIDFRVLAEQYQKLNRSYRNVTLYATHPQRVIVSAEE